MPLIYSKKPSSEHRHTEGAETCMACGGVPCKMAKGGDVPINENIRGVHNHHFRSEPGSSWQRTQHELKNLSLSPEARKNAHKENLHELKSMTSPKLKGLAHGGKVDERMQKHVQSMKMERQHGTVGVHQGGTGEGDLKGRSAAGITAEWGKKHRTDWHREGATNKSKELHSNKLNELRSMPSPNLKGLAHGGEVMDEDSQIDSELHDAMADELMSAIDNKDKKRVMEAIESLVMSCLSKRNSDD